MKSPHTPGPWSVFKPESPYVCYEGGDCPATICAGEIHVATMPGSRTFGLSETSRANAHLIASAPELLRALERLAHPMADDEDLDFALQIIAKAKGKA